MYMNGFGIGTMRLIMHNQKILQIHRVPQIVDIELFVEGVGFMVLVGYEYPIGADSSQLERGTIWDLEGSVR